MNYKVIEVTGGFRWKQYDEQGNSVAVSEFLFPTQKECEEAVAILEGKSETPKADEPEAPTAPSTEPEAPAAGEGETVVPEADKEPEAPAADAPADNTQA